MTDKRASSLADQTRFTVEKVLLLCVQVPKTHVEQVMQAITDVCALTYGDYDHVSFEHAEGTQRFRALGAGRNVATDNVVEVPCVEISAQLLDDPEAARCVVTAIYNVHPYEEPVIALTPSYGTRHIRGVDEGNPNRFWNQAMPDWVPNAHR